MSLSSDHIYVKYFWRSEYQAYNLSRSSLIDIRKHEAIEPKKDLSTLWKLKRYFTNRFANHTNILVFDFSIPKRWNGRIQSILSWPWSVLLWVRLIFPLFLLLLERIDWSFVDLKAWEQSGAFRISVNSFNSGKRAKQRNIKSILFVSICEWWRRVYHHFLPHALSDRRSHVFSGALNGSIFRIRTGGNASFRLSLND